MFLFRRKKNSKIRNLIEAKKRLKEIAKGRYHVIEYSITEYEGEIMQQCKVYISGLEYNCGRTWEEAFDELDKKIKPISHKKYKITY